MKGKEKLMKLMRKPDGVWVVGNGNMLMQFWNLKDALAFIFREVRR